MSKRRSLKARYLRLLRRIWPAPTLAIARSPFTNDHELMASSAG
jgi:hypothetical protein